MKVALVLFFSIFVFSKEKPKKNSFCEKVFKQEDLSAKGFYQKNKNCVIEVVHKKKKFALQYAFYQKGCRPYEGADLVNCGQVRSCSENKKFITKSPTLTRVVLENDCMDSEKEVKILYKSTGYKGPDIKANLICKNKKPQSVKLEVAGKTKTCPLHL